MTQFRIKTTIKDRPLAFPSEQPLVNTDNVTSKILITVNKSNDGFGEFPTEPQPIEENIPVKIVVNNSNEGLGEFPTEPQPIEENIPVTTTIVPVRLSDNGIDVPEVQVPFPTEQYLYNNENPSPNLYPKSDVLDAGRIDRGTWNPSVEYFKNEYIMYEKHKYVCIAPRSNKVIPRISPNWRDTWLLLNLVEPSTVALYSKGIGFDKVGSLFKLQARNHETN